MIKKMVMDEDRLREVLGFSRIGLPEEEVLVQGHGFRRSEGPLPLHETERQVSERMIFDL